MHAFKKIIFSTLLCFVSLSLFFGDFSGIFGGQSSISLTSSVHAASGDELSSSTKMANGVIDGINVLLGILTAIVSPVIMLAGWLMSPDWTSGDFFGLRAPMYKLWVTVSNIVYLIYAILLIIIAIGTMFSSKNYSYKSMLPRLALGILMVPFTWWFVQWTISIAAVVTASVITIPAETIQKLDIAKTGWWVEKSIPEEMVFGQDATKDGIDCKSVPGRCKSPEQVLTSASGMYGYMLVYAYSIFKFDKIENLPTNGIDVIKTVFNIMHQGIIAAIMFVVFGILTIALVFILFVRVIKLWVYAIFSPLFTFRFVAGDLFGKVDSEGTFTIKEFVGLAFVPAAVGLALSFGLIIVAAVQGGGVVPGSNGSCTSANLQPGGPGCQIASIMGNPSNVITRKLIRGSGGLISATDFTVGGITAQFRGGIVSSDIKADANDVNGITNILDASSGIFGTIVIDLIALIFVWVAFMAAKGISKAVSTAVKPFEDIGGQIKSIASKIPSYIPLPSALGGSVGGLQKGVNLAMQNMDNANQDKFANSYLGQMLGAAGAAPQETINAIKAAKNATGDASKTEKGKAQLRDTIAAGKGKSLDTLKTDLTDWFVNVQRDQTNRSNNLRIFSDGDQLRRTKLEEILKNLEKAKTDGNQSDIDKFTTIAIAAIGGAPLQMLSDASSARAFINKGNGGSNNASTGNTQSVQINGTTYNIISPTYNTSDGKLNNSTDIANDLTSKLQQKTVTENDLKAALKSHHYNDESIQDIVDAIEVTYGKAKFFKP